MARHREDPARRRRLVPAVLIGLLALVAAVAVGWIARGGDDTEQPRVAGDSATGESDPGSPEDREREAADRGEREESGEHSGEPPAYESDDAAGQTAPGPDTAGQTAAPDQAAVTAEPGLDPDTRVRLAVVGDIMLSRAVGERMDEEGTEAVLAGVREQLHDADLAVGNLESPLCADGTPAPKRFMLKADPVGLEVLADGSFDVLALANNHILDYGPECMNSTIDLLDEAGIGHVGAGNTIDEAREPLVVEAKGMRLAFLSYLQMPVERNGFDSQTWTATADSPGLPWGTPEVIAEDVKAAAALADHVIVLLHSGWEKTEVLSPEQQANGEAALEAGATAVLGAHPHRLQAFHENDGQFIAWSMGNFVFDYPDGTPESDSAILHLTLGPEGVTDHEWTPVLIQGGFPEVLDPEEGAGARILAHLANISQDYAATRG